MVKINGRILLSATTAAFLIALLLVQFSDIAQAQTSIFFAPRDEFGIPESNSYISFAVNGTYTQAALENATWHFTNLRLNNSGNNPALNFKASAQDSNLTITSCQRTNPNNTSLRLRYRVTGNGTQTFNFGLALTGGYWIVSFNGNNYPAENNGWRSSTDGTIIVTGATGNVSISYSFFSPGFGVPDDPNLSFYQKHSVAIVTFASVVVSIIVVVSIRQVGIRRQQKISRDVKNKLETSQNPGENSTKGQRPL